MNIRFVSFNINGIRAHFHQLEAIINKLNPDIIGLQETRINDDIFPVDKINFYNYNSYFYGQKQYSGVAFLCRHPPLTIKKGLNPPDGEKRVIIIDISTPIGILTVINCYSPQGENRNKNFKFKKFFYENLLKYLMTYVNKNSLLLIMGDMNISPTDLDIGIGESNKKKWLRDGKCSFLPEERKWINDLLNNKKNKLIDIYRKLNPNNRLYTWFDYRTPGLYSGLRIDLLLPSLSFSNLCVDSGIDYSIRSMNKPSDHVPIWADFVLM